MGKSGTSTVIVGYAFCEVDHHWEIDAWGKVEDFRNALVHLVDVSHDSWWDFAQEDLPALKAAVAALLADLEDKHTSK